MTRAAHKAGILPDTGEVARDTEFIAPRLALACERLQEERRSGRAAEQEANLGLGIMELKSHTCRWPIAVVGSEEFRYCGNRTVQGKPFCVLHCQKAYQPSVRNQRHYTPMGANLSGVLSR